MDEKTRLENLKKNLLQMTEHKVSPEIMKKRSQIINEKILEIANEKRYDMYYEMVFKQTSSNSQHTQEASLIKLR